MMEMQMPAEKNEMTIDVYMSEISCELVVMARVNEYEFEFDDLQKLLGDAAQCFTEGVPIKEAIAYLSNFCELGSRIPEEEALKNIDAFNKKYRNRNRG